MRSAGAPVDKKHVSVHSLPTRSSSQLLRSVALHQVMARSSWRRFGYAVRFNLFFFDSVRRLRADAHATLGDGFKLAWPTATSVLRAYGVAPLPAAVGWRGDRSRIPRRSATSCAARRGAPSVRGARHRTAVVTTHLSSRAPSSSVDHGPHEHARHRLEHVQRLRNVEI